MPSTILSDNGASSGTAGIKTTGSNDGILALQTTTAGGTATTALTIDTSQNVGIGTTSPGAVLDVRSSSNAAVFRTSDGTAANNAGSWIYNTASGTAASRVANILLDGNGGDASSSDYFVLSHYGDNHVEIRNYSNGYMNFYTNNSERARIDSSGNLLVGTTSNMAQGVGIQVGEVGIDGVSGFGMTSAVSIADDATITLSANTGLLVFIEYFDGSNYPGAMFYCSYAGAVQLVSSSGGSFAATDSDGNACVFKSNTSDVVTVKNRLGATRSYSIHTLQLRGQ
jgi:hypothetical protein